MAKTKKEIVDDLQRRELDLQRRELLSTIRQSIMDETEAIKHLEDAQEKQKLVKETYQQVKTLQETLRPWADFIEQLTKTAFKHGHSIATFKRVTKSDGKNVVIGNKIIVLKPKTLKSLFIHGIPLGQLLFDNLPELRVRVEESSKKYDVTLTEKEKRKMVVRYKEELDKEKMRKEGLKELNILKDFINERVEKAKPEQRGELRQHLEKKYANEKQAIREQYGLNERQKSK